MWYVQYMFFAHSSELVQRKLHRHFESEFRSIFDSELTFCFDWKWFTLTLAGKGIFYCFWFFQELKLWITYPNRVFVVLFSISVLSPGLSLSNDCIWCNTQSTCCFYINLSRGRERERDDAYGSLAHLFFLQILNHFPRFQIFLTWFNIFLD